MTRYSGFTLATYLVVLVCLADQMTKHWIIETLMDRPGHLLYVTPYFNLLLLTNKGVTFGILNGIKQDYVAYGLIAIAVIVVFFLGRWLWHTSSRIISIALGMIIGGAIGNVIDRVHYGAVVDFLDLHYLTYHWYAFNIADAAIVTGVCLMLFDSVVRRK